MTCGLLAGRQNSIMDTSGKEDIGLRRTGKFAGGIQQDVARRLPHYFSDWTDGLRGGGKTLTAALFMFFACMAPGIAFGAYADRFTGGEIGVVEYLITQGVSGVIFAVISGQPLVILRPTGPITVFISQLYLITKALELPFLAVQAWTGIFVGTYMIIIAVTDTCALISHCTRFTQDLFGFFVSVIFITMGIGNVVDKLSSKDGYSPAHQVLLTMITLYVALRTMAFNKSNFFNKRVRDSIADFAVPLAIVTFTIVANFMNEPLEPLPVPEEFGPTNAGRPWMVDIGEPLAVLVGAAAALPLVGLFFIDQNVTMLLTHHPDHDLKKGGAFHYNFLILGVLNIIFPLFGCPFVTGSLPHSPQFVKALAETEVVRENGFDSTRIVHVFENRISPLIVNVLVLVCLGPINSLSVVPTSVICDALFLLMGLSGLPGNQLFERLKLTITEEALYPPLPFTVSEVPRFQMHLYTAIQFSVVIMLFAVSKSPIALAFPVFLVLSIPLRMNIPKLTGGYVSSSTVAILDGTEKKCDEATKKLDDDVERASETIVSNTTVPPEKTSLETE